MQDFLVGIVALALMLVTMGLMSGMPAGYALAAIGVAGFAYAMSTRTSPDDVERKIQW